MNLYTLFSHNLSTKIVRHKPDYNKKIIESIYNKGKETDVINILNKSVRDMWTAYINNDKKNYFGFVTLQDDIEKLIKKGESNEYINKYKYIAKEYEMIFINIKERRKRFNKKKIINNNKSKD